MILRWAGVGVFAWISLVSWGQPLLLDPSFPSGTGPDSWVRSLLVQKDGRILLGGSFSNYNGVAVSPLVRVSADGSLDASFSAGPFGWPHTSHSITRVTSLSDGRILVQGYFTNVAGSPCPGIAVLKPDGALDAGFELPVPQPATAAINSAYAAKDSGVWVTGTFTGLGGVSSARIARLHPDGSVSTSFHSPFASAQDSISSILPLAGGGLLISGNFAQVAGVPAPGLVRLLPDGSVDRSFQTDLPASARINRLTLLPDGQVVGTLSQVTTGAVTEVEHTLVRLRTDGTVDPTFNPDFGQNSGASEAFGRVVLIVPDPANRLIVAGTFVSANGIQRLGLARLFADGSTDPCFDAGLGLELYAVTAGFEADGSIIVGGPFRLAEGQNRPFLARLRPESECGPGLISFASPVFQADRSSTSALITLERTGPVDRTEGVSVALLEANLEPANSRRDALFKPGDRAVTVSFPLPAGTAVQPETTLALELNPLGPDIRIGAPAAAQLVIGGTVSLLPAGTPDPQFRPVLDGPVMAATRLRSHTWLAAMSPTNSFGTALFQTELRKVQDSGSFDPAFQGTNRFDGRVSVLRELPDGRFLAGGDFSSINGIRRPGLARFAADGRLDDGFNPLLSLARSDTALSAAVSDVVVQSDGALILSGAFLSDFTQYLRRPLARVRPDGSLDERFGRDTPEATLMGSALIPFPPDSFIVQLIGSSVALGRFRSDGSRDPRFLPPAYTPLLVGAIAAAPDGSIIAGGWNLSGLGASGPALARFAGNGGEILPFRQNAARSIDLVRSSITRLQLQGDSRVLLAGSIVVGESQPTVTLLRLSADGSWDPSFDAGPGASGRIVRVFDRDDELPASIAVVESLPEGGFLVGGDFAGFNGLAQPFLVKLLPDGVHRPPGFRLTGTNLTIHESAGFLELDVVRTGDASAGASVRFSTQPLTARSGIDYVPVSEALTFVPGEWRKHLVLGVNDNDQVEPDRTFLVMLDQPSPGFGLGDPKTATITIVDDDVNVEFAVDSVSMSENDGFALVPVRRIGAAGGPLRVEVTADSRATGGSLDFAAASQQGASTNWLRLEILDDDRFQPDFTTTLRLRVTAGLATIGTRDTASLHIIDNDYPEMPGRGVAGTLRAVMPALNGGVVVAGEFTAVHGKPRHNVARLTPDGEVDLSFDRKSGPDGPVTALAEQADGAVLIAGNFASVDNQRRPGLARLKYDGDLDSSFDPGTGPFSRSGITRINCLAALPGGRFVVGGVFDQFGGHLTEGVARLLPNGQVDPLFISPFDSYAWILRPPAAAIPTSPSEVFGLEPHLDGTLLVRGDLRLAPQSPGYVGSISLVRLKPDGNLDRGFPVFNYSSAVASLASLADGKVLVGGTFGPGFQLGSSQPATNWVAIARLLPDGKLDPGFRVRNTPALASRSTIRQIIPQNDGRILFLADVQPVGTTNIVEASLLARLFSDGSWDAGFVPVAATRDQDSGSAVPARSREWPTNKSLVAPPPAIAAAALQPDGSIVIGGAFTRIGGEPRRHLAHFDQGGGLRGRFIPTVRFTPARTIELETSPEIQIPYQLESSPDLRTWSVLRIVENPRIPLRLAWEEAGSGNRQFFRLVRVQ